MGREDDHLGFAVPGELLYAVGSSVDRYSEEQQILQCGDAVGVHISMIAEMYRPRSRGIGANTPVTRTQG